MRRCGRGARSGLGIGCFVRVASSSTADAARQRALPRSLRACPFPPNGASLLLLDPDAAGRAWRDEIDGVRGAAAFPERSLPAYLPSRRDEALPALAERDLPASARRLRKSSSGLATIFLRRRADRFTRPRVAAVLDLLAREGAHGIGQSSWGPTGFAFAASQVEAALASCARTRATEGLDIRLVQGPQSRRRDHERPI